MISDGWSTGIFIRELTTAYGALAADREPDLPELPIQYPDFASWQDQWLASAAAARQLAYWRSRLAGPLPVFDTGADHSRPPVQSLLGAQEPVCIDAGRVAAMERLCREEGATLFMGMLAAFNVLLCRYSGQRELLVGTPIANRRHASTEGLIGVFINVLPIRTRIEGQRSFRELLASTREAALELFANQDLPFDRIVRALRVPRDQSRSPLFQVMFVMQNMPRAPEIDGVALTLPKLDNGTSKYDLTLQLYPEDNGTLTGFFEYCTALFDQALIRRLIDDFEWLLHELPDSADRPIGQLPGSV